LNADAHRIAIERSAPITPRSDTLQELHSVVGVGFVSLTETLDLTTPGGGALAGMAVFAEFQRDILRDRVKAGIAQARKEGRAHGRPPTVHQHAAAVRRLSES
jgi:putative DNA-invertase from lambdoid prophage Rac